MGTISKERALRGSLTGLGSLGGDGRPASLRDRVKGGAHLIGTVLSVPDLALAELVSAHFQFVWIDLEHGALGCSDVQPLAIAARAAGGAALVRLPCEDYRSLGTVLDAGVDGVVAPRVEDPGAAAALVAELRYPPAGKRGFAPRRATGYGRPQPFRADAQPACLVQIESAAAVATADAIAAVEGVDALIVGCSDLSLDLGVPLELDSSELRSAVGQVQRAASQAGIGSGVAAGGAPLAVAELAAGSTILLYSADVRIYASAVNETVATVEAALTPVWQQETASREGV